MEYAIRNSLYVLILLTISTAHALDLNNWINAMNAPNNTKFISTNSNKIGLIFVYASTCPYCRKFAPVLKEFANEQGLKVESISADGVFIDGFEDAVYSPELLFTLNIKVYPTVFAINNKTNNLSLLAEGSLSKDELYQNYINFVNHSTKKVAQ